MRNMLLFRKVWLLSTYFLISALSFAQVTEQWVMRQNGEANSPDAANDLAVDHNGNVFVTGWSQGKGTNTDFATIKYDEGSNTKWVKRYNGPGNGEDQATAIAVDHKGNVYVTGWSTGNGTGNDFTTIKYDDDGDTKWVKRYNGPGNENDQAIAIAVDDNGNVYVTGWSSGNGTGNDYTTIKYDDDGDTEWVRRYNGPGNANDLPTAIAVDKNGNVYVTGQSTGSGTGTDYATIKYDDDGNLQWVNRYNGPVNNEDRANALAVDDNGNVYVTGLTATFTDEDGSLFDIATIKYNASGLQQWAVIYNRKGHDEANALVVDAAGNVYITGFSGNEEEDPDNDYVTIKYNAAGAQQWAAIFAGPGTDQSGEATDLVLDAAGNVYITGGISIETATDYATIRYNPNGVQQWVATYDGPGNDFDKANAISLDHNGNVYITGPSRINEFGNNGDYATIKYNASGMQKWVKRYNGPSDLKGGSDMATALAVDANGNVHVTGGITKNNTGLDYTTYKYNEDGDREWKKTYNGPGTGPDEANAITLDAQGNVYVTGRSDGLGTSLDFATIKYADDGEKKWSKRYNGPGNGFDQATAIAVDENGNVYVTGVSEGSDHFGDYATIKYDKDGNTKWERRYNGPGNSIDHATAVSVDDAGNVYVTGQSWGMGTFQDYATIKYDANGNELWVARYNAGTNTSEEATALVVDASGNVYVTGRGNPTEFSPYDYATIKYNAAGVQQWAARYGAVNTTDEPRDIAVDTSGNVYVTGGSDSHYATVKYNAAGAQQWVAIYDEFGIAHALALDAGGNVYVTGASRLSNIIAEDYATVKYNNAGVQQWVARYNGPGNGSDIATDIALDDEGNVLVTGRSEGNGTGFDYATIKYEQTPIVPEPNPITYLELNNLVVVYRQTNGGIIPDNYNTLLTQALDATKMFYWRHSHMRLNIKWKVHVVNDNVNFVQPNGTVFPSAVDADLRSRGFTADAYDAVVAVVSGGGAFAWGVNAVLGRGGYCQVPWWEEKLLFSWFFVHEYHHVVDAMFASSGAPDYPHNHPAAARIRGEFVPHSGPDFDLNADILQFWPYSKWLDLRRTGNWGSIKTYTDNDLDSIPDNDPNAPFDEQRFGSNTSRIDTDGDGLTDLQEAMAGIFTPTNPTIIDFDGDGIGDASDAEPIYPLKTTVPAAMNLSLAQDVTEWPLSGHYYFEKPDAASSSLHLAYSENNLYVGVKIPSGLRTIQVFIDANNDGFFYGNDNIQVRLVGDNITEINLRDVTAVPPGIEQDFVISALSVPGFSGISKSGAGWSSYQLIIPKISQYGLNLAAGETIGIYILIEGYGTLLEPDDYLTVVLGDDLNNITTRRANNVNGSDTDQEGGFTTLHASAFPNAFSEFINLQWSGSNKPVNITITDAMGRLVEKRTNLAASGTIQTGYHFRPGVYYATIVQGREKVVVKLVKN